MKRVILLILVLTALLPVSYAQTFMNFTSEPEDSFNALLVEKSGRWLHVLEIIEGRTQVLKSFQVLTGRVNGDKLVRGDEKTPEGLYFVTGFHSPEKLKNMYGAEVSRQYGTGAYPLSYPNLKDRLTGKTGGGIWLHGVDPERAESATRGCVAFDNDKLTMLADYIEVGTPVIITDDGMQGAVDQLREHFSSIKQSVNDYIHAWEKGDFETFKSFYHANFKSVSGRNFGSYLAYKKSLMELFPYKKIDTDSFRVFSPTKDEAVVQFDQYYCAANVFSHGTKRFYMEREFDRLKIVAEEFQPKDGSGFTRAHVNSFLLDWKKSWESQDINSYISLYDDTFKTRGMDKAVWENDKSGKFEKLNLIKVEIEDIRYTAVSPISYKVEFIQTYRGDNYSDKGIKTLRLKGCPGDFKIISERWRAVR